MTSNVFGRPARVIGAAMIVVSSLFAASAFGQTPAPNPNQGLPTGHPPVGAPQPARRLDPNQVRPGGMPGQAQPGRPGLPGQGRSQPVRPAVVHEDHAAGGEHGAGHCPGHGPEDPPHFDQINWWHGMIGVDNVKSQSPSFADKLLWRYHNPNNPCDPKNQQTPLFAALLNLGVLGYLVYRFGRKPIGAALVKRKQDIMSEIETASRLEREAQGRLSEYEDKFDQIQDTLKALKVEYATQAEVEKKHIVAEAEERRARMRRDAEFRVEQELRAARISLMQQAVADATTAAEEIIRKRSAQADIDRMSEEYLASLRTALAGSRVSTQLGGKQ